MLFVALWSRLGKRVSDKTYLKVRYWLIMGEKLNLDNPQTFNQKINWLKIFNRQPYYTQIVDKSTAKDFAAKIIGENYVIPTYGVWERFEDIDFDSLPEQFVLKSTNGGGGSGVVVCHDKNSFDKVAAKTKLEASMKANWRTEREWVYRDIKPRIIAEELLRNDDGSAIMDYKIMCFNGEPKLLFFASDRYTEGESLKFDWYDVDLNLNRLPFKSKGYENAQKLLKPFPEFCEMKNVARKLAAEFPLVRVDLYLINHRIYFGELTFFHDGGVVALQPKEWEYKLGSWISLPEKYIDE